MHTPCKFPQKKMAVLLLAFVLSACTRSEPPPKSSPAAEQRSPEQRIAAVEKARTQEAEFLKELASAILQEKRDETWAAKKESEVRASLSSRRATGATGMAGAPGTLKSVECRSSRCQLLVELSQAKQASESAGHPYSGINDWIAASEPCGYTISAEEAAPAAVPTSVRIFLNCPKQ